MIYIQLTAKKSNILETLYPFHNVHEGFNLSSKTKQYCEYYQEQNIGERLNKDALTYRCKSIHLQKEKEIYDMGFHSSSINIIFHQFIQYFHFKGQIITFKLFLTCPNTPPIHSEILVEKSFTTG